MITTYCSKTLRKLERLTGLSLLVSMPRRALRYLTMSRARVRGTPCNTGQRAAGIKRG